MLEWIYEQRTGPYQVVIVIGQPNFMAAAVALSSLPNQKRQKIFVEGRGERSNVGGVSGGNSCVEFDQNSNEV